MHIRIFCRWHLGCCHEDYLPTNRGFDSFNGLYHLGGDHFLHTYKTASLVGVGPDGYDFHDGLLNDIAANNTYSTVRIRALISVRVTRFSDLKNSPEPTRTDPK